jgi:hypothetical protein
MAYTPTPKKYPKSSSASMQTGGRAKESMPRKGARPANGKPKAKTPDFKVGGSYRSGRTIQGATGTKKRVNRGGAAREGMGSVSGGRATTMGGFGATAPRKSAAGRGKGGEAMGRNKSSSAQAGKYAKPKAKAPRTRSMY